MYLEDLIVGTVRTFGSIIVDEQAIIDFASLYDPQPFHTDPEEAKKSNFEGLVASGLHTVCLAMRILVDHYISHVANLGSPGIDELRWLSPVRPGDELSVRLTTLEVTPSKSKPDRGSVKVRVEVMNQRGDVVASWKGIGIISRRKRV